MTFRLSSPYVEFAGGAHPARTGVRYVGAPCTRWGDSTIVQRGSLGNRMRGAGGPGSVAQSNRHLPIGSHTDCVL